MPEPTGEDQLHAVVSLVRRLSAAAQSGSVHGARTRDHDRQFCSSCLAVKEAAAFLDAMTADEPADEVVAQ